MIGKISNPIPLPSRLVRPLYQGFSARESLRWK